MESSARSLVPPRTRPECSGLRGRTRDSGSERVSVDACGFDVERQATARRLRSLRIRLSAIRSAVAAALMLALVLGGAGALRDLGLSFPRSSLAAPVTVFGAVVAPRAPVRFPF